MNKQSTRGFTLIELLMVIAIIGILAGILIPTVGAVREQANKAASKAQLSNYVTAITMFKGEYGYLPFISSGGGDTTIDLSDAAQSRSFIKTLSGRDPSTNSAVQEGGNRRGISFHSFSESEFYMDPAGVVSQTELADRFSNKRIKIMLDGSGDNKIDPNPDEALPKKPDNPIRSNVTAWVEEVKNDPDFGNQPGYSLWD